MQVEEETKIRIELTEEETQALQFILNKIGGCQESTARKYLSPLHRELEELGFLSEMELEDENSIVFREGHRQPLYFGSESLAMVDTAIAQRKRR